MAVILALLEAVSLLAVVSVTIVVWGHLVMTTWTDAAVLMVQTFALSLCCLVAFYFNDLYDLRVVPSLGPFAPRLVQSIGIAFIILTGFYIAFPETKIAEGPAILSFVSVAAFLLPLRAVSYGVIRSRPFIEPVLIVGTGALSQKLIDEIQARPDFRYAVVGVADDGTAAEGAVLSYPLLGPLRHLGKIIEEVRPSRIIVALPERRGRLPISELLEARLRGIPVEDGVTVYERLTGKLAIESVTPSSLIFSADFRKSRFDLVLGRSVSFLASVVGLLCLTPLFGLIALMIKLDSRGPVFFVQDRVGLSEKRFRLIKFRTMHPVDDRASEWVRDNGHRITRTGKWLRRFRLDELPQFVNTLKGDMNLVGPRPHPVSNFQLFMENIPYYSLRSMVRPGITGWAQIRYGYANNLREETEKMRYDLFYIKHMSLWLDLRIIFETIKIVLLGKEKQL